MIFYSKKMKANKKNKSSAPTAAVYEFICLVFCVTKATANMNWVSVLVGVGEDSSYYSMVNLLFSVYEKKGIKTFLIWFKLIVLLYRFYWFRIWGLLCIAQLYLLYPLIFNVSHFVIFLNKLINLQTWHSVKGLPLLAITCNAIFYIAGQ